jgi:hypothetical protein
MTPTNEKYTDEKNEGGYPVKSLIVLLVVVVVIAIVYLSLK